VERELSGVGVSPGRVVGPVVHVAEPVGEPANEPSREPPAAAYDRALSALAAVAADLDARAVDSPAADVLEVQAMMARDPELAERVHAGVSNGRTAARAVWEAIEAYRTQLAAAGGYLAERVADLDDVRARAVSRLVGLPMPGIPEWPEPFVLVARDLAPAAAAALPPGRVLAVVTEEGGPTSHTAVLARQLGLPAVVACRGALALPEGSPVYVDGATGRVVGTPGKTLAASARGTTASLRARPGTAADHAPGQTRDGVRIALLANVGTAAEAAAAAAAGAEGIGLLRTEFLFLSRRDAPSREEQAAAYAAVLSAFPGRRVVVRTLDGGTDKPLPFLRQAPEPNPALGLRGLRLAGEDSGVLREQLAALALAATRSDAHLEVMAPMVATAEEASGFAALTAAAGLPTTGVMVEVPAAALCADDVLRSVDFLSLGTNDLCQYATAADRMLAALAPLNDPWQPALLRLVEMTAAAGARAGKPVGVCGEAGGDVLLAPVLVGLGVTSLSMAAPRIDGVRAVLRRLDAAECRTLAARALAAGHPVRARETVAAALAPVLDDVDR